MKKRIIILGILFLIIGFTGTILVSKFLIFDKKDTKEIKKEESKEVVYNYTTYVRAKKITKLYNKMKKEIGSVSKDTYITLDDSYNVKDGYCKLKNLDYYILYEDLVSTEVETLKNNEYKTYKNYVAFNEALVTNDEYKLYLTDNNYINIKDSSQYDILIKDDNRYGIDFNDHLVYINKMDVKEIISTDNTLEHTDAIAVLNYHFTIDPNSPEGSECLQSICMSQTQVEEEIKYLKDNGFYAATMEDFYLFMTGKIQLPKKTVVITIDDGWYLARMIAILEKHQMMGTLFLIGSLASPTDYTSDYLEVHSHTWDMHTPGVCAGSFGGGLLCQKEQVILEDLKKSRESLNNTEFFCYPFYEYNVRAINLLKQSGFKMAFAGGERKAKLGDDLFSVPRFALGNYTTLNDFISFVE